ncbi:hypothetical protein INR49_027638, partial [Caranx melampygus]
MVLMMSSSLANRSECWKLRENTVLRQATCGTTPPTCMSERGRGQRSACCPFLMCSSTQNISSLHGEPSAPKLEVKVQNRGNSLKVNWIKQDDGGSPIKHYLIRYKAVSTLGKE